MKYNFIHIKLKDKDNFYLNNNKMNEIFKTSFGDNIINLYYNKNKKESSKKYLEIIYYKRNIKTNIGKMIYKNVNNSQVIQILNRQFVLNNKERARIIIDNKQYILKGNIKKQKPIFKIKIKFFDYIFFSNNMFNGCKSLFSVKNFQNINTKYLKEVYGLFAGCTSLIYIDDISNWNMNNINH